MSLLLELAERCQQATGPDAELDADICVAALGYVEVLSDEGDWRSFIGPKGRVNVLRGGAVASPELPRLTASLDAAMTLVPKSCLQPSDIVREALNALGKHFSLHVMHWPMITPYRGYLARFVAAAALKVRAASADRSPKGGGPEEGRHAKHKSAVASAMPTADAQDVS